jgi:hypothetical protein
MKTNSLFMVGAIVWQLSHGLAIRADDTQPPVKVITNIRHSEDADIPNAVVLSIHGKCEYSEDGVHFTELKSEQVLTLHGPVQAGAKISTEVKSQFTLNRVPLSAHLEIRALIFFFGASEPPCDYNQTPK